MNKKWVFALCMALMLVLSACGSSNGKGNGDQQGSNVNNNSNSSDQEVKKERAKISIMTPFHTAEVPDTRIEEMIEEKLNVDLDIQWIPHATFGDRMSAALATNSLADVVIVSLSGPSREAIQDDQFWDITDYIDQYENLKKLNPAVMDNMLVDGRNYSLYQGRPLSRQGIIFRNDWAKNLGLSAPTNFDELYNMIEQFTINDPDQNGLDDTIGLADRGDLRSGAFKTVASWNGTPNEWGVKDNKITPWFMFDEYRETMDFFKKLYDNGYINQDFPVTSKTEHQNLMINGKAGVYIACMCDVNAFNTAAVQLNPDVDFDVHNRVYGPSGEFTVFSGPGYNHPYLFPKSSIKTEEKLQEVLSYMNELMSTEMSNLIFWGIEGEHYDVVDGKAVPISDQGKIDREVRSYNTIEVGDPDTNGRYVGMHQYATLAKAEELYTDNNDFVVHDPTLTLNSEAFTRLKNRLDQIMDDATYNYILGVIDESGFNAEIDRWLKEGGKDVIEEFTADFNR